MDGCTLRRVSSKPLSLGNRSGRIRTKDAFPSVFGTSILFILGFALMFAPVLVLIFKLVIVRGLALALIALLSAWRHAFNYFNYSWRTDRRTNGNLIKTRERTWKELFPNLSFFSNPLFLFLRRGVFSWTIVTSFVWEKCFCIFITRNLLWGRTARK